MLSLITKGILAKKATTTIIETARVYCPLTVNINEQKPTIIIRPIRKQINLTVKCED